MKHLTALTVDDLALLDEMAGDRNLDSYPELRDHLAVVRQQYIDYQNFGGDTWQIIPATIPLTLAERMRAHYNSQLVRLFFLDEIKDELSPDVCPMCGSLKTGTRDHVLPKQSFPEFSVLSRNLVPACDCNSLRSSDYQGAIRGERVLHPYFDVIQTQRLVYCEFSGDFEVPDMQLRVTPGAPNGATVRFHLNKVISRTNVLNWLEKKWAMINRAPPVLTNRLSAAPIIDTELRGVIEDIRLEKEDELGTPNSWYSMLYTGLLESPGVIPWLTQRLNGIRAGTIVIG